VSRGIESARQVFASGSRWTTISESGRTLMSISSSGRASTPMKRRVMVPSSAGPSDAPPSIAGGTTLRTDMSSA
jgi:hypothetical protein